MTRIVSDNGLDDLAARGLAHLASATLQGRFAKGARRELRRLEEAQREGGKRNLKDRKAAQGSIDSYVSQQAVYAGKASLVEDYLWDWLDEWTIRAYRNASNRVVEWANTAPISDIWSGHAINAFVREQVAGIEAEAEALKASALRQRIAFGAMVAAQQQEEGQG